MLLRIPKMSSYTQNNISPTNEIYFVRVLENIQIK